MSISQNFPAISPSLSLNFARSKTLDPRITFARPSTSGDATYMNENGLIVTAAADEPRFDHKIENGVVKSLGLLIEQQRTNLTKNSGTLTDYGDQRVTNSTVSTGGPFGTGYHEKTISEVGGQYNFHGNNQISITAGQTITFSIFFKNISIDANEIYLRFWTGEGRAWTTQRQVRYNLSTLTATDNNTGTIVNKSIQAFPDGWYRLSMTATADQNGYAAESFLTSGNSIGEKYQLMGAQVEVGSFPTSYIPTSGSEATRSPDNVSMTGTNFSDWYNQNEGTIHCSFRAQSSETKYLMGISNNSAAELIYIRATSTGSDSAMRDGGLDVAYKPIAYSRDIDTLSKHCVSYKQDDFIVSAQGQISTVDDGCTVPTPTNISIGSLYNTTQLGGTISQLTYYPKRLTNTQLQNLTK